MIATFPYFSKLDIDHKEEMTTFTRNFEPYSDFSFVNLFSWNVDGTAEIAWLNDNIVIKLPDYLQKGKYIYSIIGIHNMDESIEQLLAFAPRLDLVPQFILNNLVSPEKYAIAENRDSFDYVYKVDDLAQLPGGAYKKKRHRVHQTLESLGDRLEFFTTAKMTSELRLEMLDVLKRWQVQTDQPREKIELEDIAITRLFDHFDLFELQITACRIDGKLQGFSIHEVLDEAFSICHFEKTITSEYDGIGVVLINEAAKALAGKSVLVNWEQDLGLPGLKKSKLSYCPVKYQRKYWISKGHQSPAA
ncbi:phosphatidylglycerol lysyltransferase domain-containing protein [soil metagenome]